MPSAVVKKYAEETGKSIQDVEAIWDEAKITAKKKFDKRDSHFWAYVNAVTKKRCGISEAITLKDVLLCYN